MDDARLIWREEVRIGLTLLADILAALERIERLLEEDDGEEEEEEAQSRVGGPAGPRCRDDQAHEGTRRRG